MGVLTGLILLRKPNTTPHAPELTTRQTSPKANNPQPAVAATAAVQATSVDRLPVNVAPKAEDPAAGRKRWAERLGAIRVVGTHEFPANEDGSVRQITWFETPLKHPLVRLEQRWAPSDSPDGPGVKLLGEEVFVASQVLVGLPPDTAPATAIARLREEGFTATPVPQVDNVVTVAISNPLQADAFDTALDSLRRSRYHVAFAEPDPVILIEAAPSDPRFSAQWHLTSSGEDAPAAINAEGGWLVRTDASSVIVAVTDTGTRTTHEDLAANLWVNSAEIPGNGIDDDGNGIIDDVHGFNAIAITGDVSDDNGHGTHVAGVVGARGNNALGVTGVAWNVRLLSAKFLNNRGVGVTSDAISAIHYARLHGAHIINASWSQGTRSLALEDAIRQAGDAGIAFVAASGNQGADIDASPRYPAAFSLPNIVSVTATDRSRSLTTFSNYGRDRVHLAAPGEGILSTYNLNDAHYSLLTGTSAAAPQVSGALALLKALHPTEDGLQLIQRLLAGTRLSPSLAGRTQTGGILHLPTLLATTTSTPPNDLRATLYSFDGYHGVWSGSTTHAGRSTDDPASLTGDRTLWFSWTAPVSGHAQWQVDATDAATFSSLYRLDGAALSSLHSTSGTTQTFRVWAEAGKTYLLGVGTTSANGHGVTVNLALPPENDLRAAATVLTGESFSVTGNNRGATRETGEPRHARVGGGRSVWWSWTAPRTARQVITTLDSPFDTVLAVYRTGTGGDLIEVASNDDSGAYLLTSRVAFDATEGMRYLIAVDSWGGDSGSGTIRLGGYGPGNILVLSDPFSHSVRLGSSTTLQVRFLSTIETSVQWFKDGQPIGGGRDGKLVIGNVSAADLGSYHAVISNVDETVSSAPATLSERISAPLITWSTGNLSEVEGNPITLRVIAEGSQPWSLQWLKNGQPVSGATSESLYFSSLTASDAGEYEAVITNGSGTTRSTKFKVTVAASPLTAWTWVTAPDQGWPINDLRFFNNTYHALASAPQSTSTKILRSTDGVTWQAQMLPPAFEGYQIAQGNDTLIVAGRDHTSTSGQIYRSTDNGVTWSLSPLSFRGSVTYLEFGGGYFVAFNNYDNTLRRSTNGVTWTAPVTPPAAGMNRLIRQGSRFFAYNNGGAAKLFSSTDGNTWTESVVAASGSVKAVIYNNDLYHTWTGTAYFQSADGITWTQIAGSGGAYTSLLVHDGTRFVSADSSQFQLLLSTNATSWTQQAIPASSGGATIKSLLRANGRTLIGCANGLILAASETTQLEGTFRSFSWWNEVSTRIDFSGDEFILSNRSNSISRTAFSSDGESWKTLVIPSQTSLASGRLWKAGGYYWAASSGSLSSNTFWRGRSPLNLQRVSGSPSATLSSVAFHDGRFLAVAGNQLFTSIDEGLTWTPVALGASVSTGAQLYRVGGRWFLVGSGTLASSSDGVTWQFANGPTSPSYNFCGFTGHNGRFYVVNEPNDKIWESLDGVTWSAYSLPADVNSGAMLYSHRGSLLLMPTAASTGETIYATTDLSSWATINTGITASYFATGRGVMVGLSSTPHIVYNGQASSRAPVCRVLNPLSATQIAAHNLIEFAVDASSPDGNFDRVELYVDDTLVATSTSPGVFRHAFTPTENRSYSFHARAYNTDGLVTTDSLVVTATSPAAAPSFVTGDTFTSGNVFSDGDAYYAVSANSLYRSTDGLNWDFHSITTSLSAIDAFSFDAGDTRLHFSNGLRLIVSRDGLDWINITTTSPVQYRSGVFFRFSGSNGTGSVSLSSNGSSWQTTPSRPQTYFTTVLMGDGPRYLGWSSTVHPYVRRSDDGINWTDLPDLPRPATGIEALGRFILRYPDNQVRTSSDGGVTWTTSNLGVAVDKLMPVGNVVFATYGSQIQKTSTDGVVWQTHSVTDLSANVVYGDGLYVSAGFDKVRVSTDGLSWSTHTPPWVPFFSTPVIVHGPAGFIAFLSGQPGWISTDGVNWTSGGLASTDGGNWQSYQAIGNTQVAIRDVSVALNPIKRSIDGGNSWTFATPPYSHPVSTRALYSTGSAFVLRGSNGKLYRSTDGAAWTAVPVIVEGAEVVVQHLLAQGNLWQALANDNYLYRSTDDGVTWSRHMVSADTNVDLVELHFSGQNYLAVAYAAFSSVPLVFRSDDGLAWSPTSLPTGVFFSSRRAAGLGRFVIISGVKSYISDNATDWTPGPQPPAVDGIVYVTSTHFYMLNNGALHRSANATVWELVRTGVTGTPVELNGVLHAVGPTATMPLHFGDAAALAVTVSTGTYGIGDTLTAQVTIANLGETTLPDMDAALYFSRDTFHDNSDDFSVGSFTIPASALPPPGETRTVSGAVVLPPSLEGGQFHVGVRLDPANRVGEFSKANNRRLTATVPVTVPEWTLDLQTNGDGGVAQSVSSVRYVHGSTLTLTPSAGKNATFSGWSGSESSDRPDLTVTLRNNTALTASFAATRQLSVVVRGAGTVQLNQPGGRYAHGADATLLAIPAPGWRFAGWEEDLIGSTPSRTLLMSADRAVVARFDFPKENWKAAHFTSDGLANPAISGDDAVPGPLGLSNLLSYLAGRAPDDATPFNAPPEIRGNVFFYRFTRNTGSVGSRLIAEASTDLVNWTVPFSERVIEEVAGVESVEAIIPQENRPRIFVRLRAVPDTNSP